MKKNVFYLLLAVLGFVVLPSCSKEDDEKDYAKEIAKTYEGALKVESIFSENNIVITRTGTNKVQLTLKNFSYGSIPLGNIEVNDVVVTKSDSIRLSATDKPVTVTVLGSPVSVLIDIEGASLNNALVLHLTVKDIPAIGTLPVFFTTDKSVIPPAGGGGDDDTEEPVSEIWDAIEGDYRGAVLGNGTSIGDRIVAVTKTGNNTIQAVIPNVQFDPKMPIFEFTFPITVTSDESGKLTFTGSVVNTDNKLFPTFPITLTGFADELDTIQFDAEITFGETYTLSYGGSK